MEGVHYPQEICWSIESKGPFLHLPSGGRLLSSEDEEEDSDLDGFIDDTPLEEEGADISSYIKEIFGYDKSK